MAWPLAPREMWAMGTNFQMLTQLPKGATDRPISSTGARPSRPGGYSSTELGPLSLNIRLCKPPRQRAFSWATLGGLGTLFPPHLPGLHASAWLSWPSGSTQCPGSSSDGQYICRPPGMYTYVSPSRCPSVPPTPVLRVSKPAPGFPHTHSTCGELCVYQVLCHGPTIP